MKTMKKNFTLFHLAKRSVDAFAESVCIDDIPAKNLASARMFLEVEKLAVNDFMTVSHVRYGNRFLITIKAYDTTVGHAAGSTGTRIVGEFLDYDAMEAIESSHQEARDMRMKDFVSVVLHSMEAALMEA